MSRLGTILINFLIAFLIGYFLILPKYQTLKDLKLTLQEKKAELQYKEEYFSNIKKISEELKKYELELAKIDSAFPPDPSLPSLFNFLEKASSQNGLILKSIGPFQITFSEEKLGIKEIYLNIVVTGSYPAFKNFLSTLEKTARLIEIENINFAFPEKEESPAFNLKIKTHSY